MKPIFKRLLPYILAIFAVMLISCEGPAAAVPETPPAPSAAERGIGEAVMSVSLDKRLSAGTDQAIKYWEFMATPNFVLAPGDGDIVGVVDYWRQLDAITTPDNGNVLLETSLGRYMGGSWLFEVRALNKNGHVLYIGQRTLIVRDGLENLVDVTVYPDSADGTHGESADDTSRRTGVTDKAIGTVTTERYGSLHTGFIINQLEEDLDDMKITVTAQKMERMTGALGESTEIPVTWERRTEGERLTSWYENASAGDNRYTGNGSTTVPKGKVYYEGSYNMDAGVYLVSYSITARNRSGEWTYLGGQTFNVTMVGGEETTVKGYLTAGSYVVSGIKISVPGTIYGSINGKGSVVSTAASAVTLSWYQDERSIANSDEVPVSFEWYFEDELLPYTSSTITLQCPVDGSGNPIYGVYRVSLCPIGSAGSRGHADINVVFNPPDALNLSDYDWESARTYAETLDGIYDVDPGITGNQIVIGYVKGSGTPVKWTSSTKMVSYPYPVRVRTLKEIYSVADVGLSPVYVTTASDLASSRAESAWFGPTATLGSASSARCTDLREVRFVPNATAVQSSACAMCTGLENIRLHARVTSIGANAFDGCSSLRSIGSLPAATFGAYVFRGCTSLQRAYIPDGAAISTSTGLFSGCTSLWDVTLPEGSNVKVPDSMFRNCTALSSISIPAKYTTLGTYSFSGSGLVSFTGTGITTVGAQVFQNATALQRFVAENVTAIGDYAFDGCTSLGEARIGTRLSSLGQYAFRGCTSLGSFDLPGTVVNLATGTFQNCTSLSSVQFASGTTTIGTYAFAGCTSLNALLTPTTLTTIGANAYNGCTNLRHVIMSSAVKSIGANAFAGCTNLLEAEFKTTSGWKAGSTALTAAQMSNLVMAGTLLRSTYVASAWSRT